MALKIWHVCDMDLVGQTFGKLTAIAIMPRTSPKRCRVYLCQCVCGTQRQVESRGLLTGTNKTCGQKGCKYTVVPTHRASKTAEFKIWAAMRYRCENPKNSSYRNYGARGISVCKRWQKFENFLADVGHRPSVDHSIDRINNDGNYTPNNVRWATASEQGLNKRLRTGIKIGKETKNVPQWARKFGLSQQTIWSRIMRGESGAQLVRPARETGIVIGGKRRSVLEWSELAGVSPKTIRTRIARGWTGKSLLLTPRTEEQRIAAVRAANKRAKKARKREIGSLVR